MCFLWTFGCEIIFLCSVRFWHQQDSNSNLFKGSIDHVTSYCKWPVDHLTHYYVHLTTTTMGKVEKQKVTKTAEVLVPFANITLLAHSVLLAKRSQALWGKWNNGYINCFILMVNEFCVEIKKWKISQICDFGGHSAMNRPSQLITIVSWWRAAMVVWNVMINSKVTVVRQMTGWLGLPWSGKVQEKSLINCQCQWKVREFYFPCTQDPVERQKYWWSGKTPKQMYMCKSGLFF